MAYMSKKIKNKVLVAQHEMECRMEEHDKMNVDRNNDIKKLLD